MDDTPLHVRYQRRIDPRDLDARMRAAVEMAGDTGGEDEPYDLCVREAMDGLDWLTEENVQALCLAAARDARRELLLWLDERDADLAARLRALLTTHGFR